MIEKIMKAVIGVGETGLSVTSNYYRIGMKINGLIEGLNFKWNR